MSTPSVSVCSSLAVLLFGFEAGAQVPVPSLHEGIAASPPGVSFASRAAPLVGIADGVWNHGEGFGAGADHGAWFDNDDGTGLQIGDVHTWSNWATYVWTAPDLTPATPFTMERFVGYLRPAGMLLPQVHPLYGAVGPFRRPSSCSDQ